MYGSCVSLSIILYLIAFEMTLIVVNFYLSGKKKSVYFLFICEHLPLDNNILWDFWNGHLFSLHIKDCRKGAYVAFVC
jgi:hypothetical protein